MNKEKSIKSLWIFAILALILLIALDQFTKYLAVQFLAGSEPHILIPGVFELQYLENRGAAFGMLQDKKWLFVIMSGITLALIGYFYHKFPTTKRYLPLRMIAVLLAAGAVGNMIDRVLNGYVVDFFYFSLINFPIFNVADCYVTISLALIIVLIFFYYKDEDFEFLSRKKKGTDGEK